MQRHESPVRSDSILGLWVGDIVLGSSGVVRWPRVNGEELLEKPTPATMDPPQK